MSKRGDTITTLSGRTGKIVCLHWKGNQVDGYTVQFSDDKLYPNEAFFIPATGVKDPGYRG